MRTLGLLFCLSVMAPAQPKVPVWIDADPSVAPGGHEIDDGIALLQAFASPELDTRGISIVFGSTDLVTAGRIGREIVGKFGPRNAAVYDGAAGSGDIGKETAATRAMAGELRRTRPTILSLGPATNVAALIRNHPELTARIDRVVAVAGRRPGQRFRSGPAQRVPFRDLNFELDPEAFRTLLDAGVPLVLAPWEISAGVWLHLEDMKTTATTNPGMRWMLPAATDWLALWKREFGANGFNPFDALAVGFVITRQHMECKSAQAVIQTAPDDTVASPPVPDKPYLLVRPVAGTPANVTYCFAAKAGFKTDLLAWLRRGIQ